MTAVASLIDRLDARLPQTQCRQCGYDGCRPYAAAIAEEGAPIDRCPPGGQAGVQALADVLDVAAPPLDLTRGRPVPLQVALIDEAHCIGCTLCIQACPVDAIVGANKRMHTILPDVCTGCDLCVAPCPVDCISMVPAGRAWTADDAALGRQRHRALLARQQRARVAADVPVAPADDEAVDKKRAAIAQALAQARARREQRRP
ncbi:MAG: RnfABCDGE type electron transport complex subunit B [Achromobacter sp.]